MKTKNILKIGVFGVVILSLLISPILKSNSSQVKAATPDVTTVEFCKKYSTMNLPDYAKEQGISEVAAKAEYVERCCDPGYDWGVDQQLINNRCDTLSGGVELAIEMGATTEVTGTAKELKATEVCSWLIYKKAKPDSNVWSMLTGDEDDRWWSHKVCTFQIGALEGIGKMIAGTINSLTAQIFWVLDPNTYGGFVTNKGVVEIWGILRNFMNLALILILIIIAVSTILGIKKYRWQEILWKLVLIALLINFSLILPGVLLDISHFITYTFINLTQDLNNNESIAQTVMNLYLTDEISGPEKYSASYGDTMGTIKVGEDIKTEIKIEKEGWGLAWGNFFLVLAALALIGLFAFMSLIAIFFVMMFRSFIIIILLAVSPIAFAAWILPNTQKFWELWWEQFTRWCLFPITFAISLYAGIVVLNGMNSHLAAIGASNDKLGIIAMLVQIILFSMFLIGGLVVSIQSSGAVGKIVQKQVSRAGWLAGAFAAKRTTGAITESSTYKKAGKLLTKVPLLGGVGQEMMVAGEKAKTGRVKEHEKNLENIGLGSLKELEKAPAPSPLDRNAYERRIALTNKLADMGELSKESVEFIKMHKGDARLGASAITKAIPHYFKLEEGQLVETGKPIKSKVEALSRIKSDKMKEKTQSSDFVKDIVDNRKDRASAVAMRRGKTKEEAEEFANRTADSTFDKTIQEIINTLSPAQMAAFWHSLSPKDLIKKGWGGPNGKIMKAIEKDPATKKKFEQHLNDSKPLRAESGIDPQIFHPDTDSPDTDSDELERIENIFK